MVKGMGNSTSKLYYVKPLIEQWESAHNSCRQYQTKLSRIRIEQTRLTHGHLISINNQHLKPETDNKTFPTRLLAIEGQQKKTQYPG